MNRVFINNKPYGLFGVQEDFENPWLANEFNNGARDNFNQGTLYDGNFNASLAYLGNNVTIYSEIVADNGGNFGDTHYEIKENPSKNSENITDRFDELTAFTKFLSSTPPTTQSDAVALWNERVDTDSVLRRYNVLSIM